MRRGGRVDGLNQRLLMVMAGLGHFGQLWLLGQQLSLGQLPLHALILLLKSSNFLLILLFHLYHLPLEGHE